MQEQRQQQFVTMRAIQPQPPLPMPFILWTSSGDGSFTSATVEDAVYTPGTNDIAAGTVTLTMTVTGSM